MLMNAIIYLMDNSKKYSFMSYRDIQRRQLQIFLKDFCVKTNLPDFMVDKIHALHTKINEILINQKRVFRARRRIGFIGLCILSECNNEKIEISINYLAEKLDVAGRDIRKTYYYLKKIIPDIKGFLNYPYDYDDIIKKYKENLANRTSKKIEK